MRFSDRTDAGRRLAARLQPIADEKTVVLALPRGGVPVAFEVASALGAPLDVIVVRKLGLPFQPELAMGAIGEDGARILNDDVIKMAGITPEVLEAVERRERAELERRARRFRGARPRVDLAGRTALIVDDGIATGSTARAACRVARAHGAAKVVLAVPVAPPDVEDRFRGDADQVIAVQTPEMFYAIGQFYRDFSQTTDSEVVDLLVRASGAEPPAPTGATGGDPPLRSEDVEIPAGPVSLAGHLEIPEDPLGIVVFAHGSGSSRHSSRNRYVATALNEAAIGTLLFDLLTEDEEHDRANVFDIELLARRLGDATRWLRSQPGASGLAVGYFGASTGAAAALRAAAELGDPVAAVVSRGGRPDLAGSSLASVVAPTRLIVGGRDTVVLDLNRKAQQQLRCENDLVVVPGATHLFEEPGALALAAGHAREWFTRHLAPAGGGCRDGDLPP